MYNALTDLFGGFFVQETGLLILAIVLGVLLVLFLVFLIATIVLASKNKKYKKRLRGDSVEDVKIIDGVRYSISDTAVKNGEVKVSHVKGDILLRSGRTYKAKKDTTLIPGKYTVLSADENSDSFNVRIGGYVREIRHFDSIVLSEGDEISPVSHNIILR